MDQAPKNGAFVTSTAKYSETRITNRDHKSPRAMLFQQMHAWQGKNPTKTPQHNVLLLVILGIKTYPVLCDTVVGLLNLGIMSAICLAQCSWRWLTTYLVRHAIDLLELVRENEP